MTDPNPKHPGQYWASRTKNQRRQLLARALQRTTRQLTGPVDRETMDGFTYAVDNMAWDFLPDQVRELLMCGMYDGFDCDRCGGFIADVPDGRLRHVTSPTGEGVYCPGCGTELGYLA
jgi:hypothetical protein